MNMSTISTRNALPFWLSLGVVPLLLLGATFGGWTTFLVPLYAWYLFSILDRLLGMNKENPDPETDESELALYRLITMIWFPIQFVMIYGLIYFVTHSDHLTMTEVIVLFFSLGVSSGTIGIVYAHELLHQRNRVERWLGDLLLASVLYSHFRTEHLLVHHKHVGTRRDAVTALYNEGFHHFWRGAACLPFIRAIHIFVIGPCNSALCFWRYYWVARWGFACSSGRPLLRFGSLS